MKRLIINFFVVLICLCLQCTALKVIAFAGIAPNLLIILPVLFGFLGGQREGIYMGFFTGLIFDLFYSTIIGLNALIFTIIGFCAGLFKEHYNKEEMIIPLGVVLVGDFGYGFINYIFNFLLRNKLNLSYYLGNIIIPEVVYTMFLTILIYKIILWIYKFENKKHGRKVTKYVL